MDKFERMYTIPLADAHLTTRVKATNRAVKLVQAFIKRHAKVDEKNVRLSGNLNHFLWAHGRKKPPRRVKIKLLKENDMAWAYLHDEKIEVKKPAEAKPAEKPAEKPAAKTEAKPAVKEEKKEPAKAKETPVKKEEKPAEKQERAK
ncbi:MAG: 50S ribosomal protein L31e [Candidatus Micrarchaeota archaeon]